MSGSAPRIRLHILPPEANAEAAQRYACRLLAILYLQGRSIYVHLPSPAAVAAMDEMLWCCERSSFVPHSHADPGHDSPRSSPGQASVQLGTAPPEDGRELLLNLCPTVPQWFGQFSHIVEVVATEEGRAAARQRWQQYRAAGVAPEMERALSEFPETAL